MNVIGNNDHRWLEDQGDGDYFFHKSWAWATGYNTEEEAESAALSFGFEPGDFFIQEVL